jgi:polyribonucleotide nucleotidyltransferase
LIAETGAQIEVEDDGTVSVSGLVEEAVDRAVEKIQLMTKEVLAGEIYDGEVKRVESFGAFIEILPGRDGMVHVSDMSTDFVNDAHDKVAIGDKVQVRVKEIDNLGRINLSMLLDPASDAEKKERRSSGEGGGYSGGGSSGGGGGRPSYNRGGFRRGGFSAKGGPASGWRRGGGNSNSSAGGPHFPASRLMGDS